MKNTDYSCLECYVGYRGVCEDVEGTVCVNDLPGVEARTFVETATVEDLTGLESFKSLRREAAVRTGRDFLVLLRKKYDIAVVADRQTVGDIDTTNLVDNGAFTLYRSEHQMSLHLERIKIWCSKAGQIKIVFDGAKPILYDVVAGYNILDFSGISGDQICVEIGGVDGVQLAAQCSEECDCGDYAHITGHGIAIVTFSVKCDQIVCLFADELKYATRYMTAALLMEQIEFSDRKNPLARNSKENAGRIRARIMGTKDPVTELVNNSLYYKELKEVVDAAVLSGPCVTCNSSRYIEQIP